MRNIINAGVAQLVERHLPKVNVVSSNLITRFVLDRGCSSVVEHHVANVRVVSSSLITRLSEEEVLRV